MNDQLTQLALFLTAIVALSAGMIATLKNFTSISARVSSVIALALGAGLGALCVSSGFVTFISAVGLKGTLIGAAWGFVAAAGGHAFTSQSVQGALKS